MQVSDKKHLRRVFTDWTFIGGAIASIAFIAALGLGQIAPSLTVIGVLLAFWIFAIVLLYARVLEVLEEGRNSSQAMLEELKKIQIDTRNATVTQMLPVISMEAFAQLESQLTEGDSVLVFANTLEVDYQPMFDAVVDNLKKGVCYRYILFEEEQIASWEKFIRILTKKGVTNLPQAVFEYSRIANLLKSSTAIYDYEDSNRIPDGFCVLETTHQYESCIMLSPLIAKQTRDAFIKVWRSLEEGTRTESLRVDRDTSLKQLAPSRNSAPDSPIVSRKPPIPGDPNEQSHQ